MKDRSKKENLTSFRHYYETNVSSLMLFAQRFVTSDIVEDIVHDVFLEVWNLMEKEEDLPTRSFLFAVIRNRCLNILKREQVKEKYIHTTTIDNRLLGLDYYDSCEKLIIEN